MAAERDAIQNLQTGNEWIDALLDLFFAVQLAQEHARLPLPVEQAYARAEKARQEL